MSSYPAPINSKSCQVSFILLLTKRLTGSKELLLPRLAKFAL